MLLSHLNPNILFVSDYGNHSIRMVDISNRNVVTICGNGKKGFQKGIGKESQFKYPKSLIVDYEDKIFVCDFYNHSIRIVKRRNLTTTNTSTPTLPKSRFNWIFSSDKFSSTPSNRDGISVEEELALRQQAAVFIYELGTNLKVYVFDYF